MIEVLRIVQHTHIKVKPLSLFIFNLLIVVIYAHAQKVQGLVFDCLEDIRSGGRVIEADTSTDTIKISLKTYGPCEADFDVRMKEIEISGIVNVFFEIYDKCETYQGGKLECGCMFLLQFNLLDYELKDNFRGWAVNNKTMPKKAWEEWFWDNID